MKNTPFTTNRSGKLSFLRGLIFIVVMMLATSSTFAQAHIETIDGLRYLIDENAKNATLVANPDEKYSGDVVVPEKVTAKDEKEYPVTEFGENCFNGCNELKSVIIPSSVTSLGDYCFAGCSCLTNINIPFSVTSLGNYCFYYCLGLTNVNIPSSVTSLGSNCFAGCSRLTNINIPSSVTLLGNYCFYNCFGLTNVNIPSSVTSLGSNCFESCSGLTKIIIPSSITSLGNNCFARCLGLTSITIPSSVTSLGSSCFDSCNKLDSIYFEGNVSKYIKYSKIPPTCIFYVPKEYLQDYKDAGGYIYQNIYEWKKGGDDKPVTKCETPTITYADGSLQFTSSTTGAEYHYTITDADMAKDKLSQDGKVQLAAAYKISAYATADGYQPSDKATATLYWINANLENDPSTNINLVQTRGIVATCNGGIVTLSGLDNGEVVRFFSPDGRQLGAAKAENGIASCAVTGSIVIAKLGVQSIKLIVK